MYIHICTFTHELCMVESLYKVTNNFRPTANVLSATSLILILVFFFRTPTHGKCCTSSDFHFLSFLFLIYLLFWFLFSETRPTGNVVPAAILILILILILIFYVYFQKRDPRQMLYQQRCADEEAEKVAKKKQQEVELRRLRQARRKTREKNKNKLIASSKKLNYGASPSGKGRKREGKTKSN